jgi:hypothetical protein
MTDSIKHFTGFDISGKSEGIYSMNERNELMMPMMVGKLIDEILS